MTSEFVRTNLLTAFEQSDGTVMSVMVASVVSKIKKDEQGIERETPLFWHARNGADYHSTRDAVIRKVAHDGCPLTEPVARAAFPRLADLPYKRLDVVVATVANNSPSGGIPM